MGFWQPWTPAETDLFERYFRTQMTEMTLYQHILRVNPRRSYESMTRELRRWRTEKGYEKNKERTLKKLRVGYLDIECTHLKANFGFILTWYIKPAGKSKCDWSMITREEIQSGDFDKRVIAELLDALHKYDVIYTHWGIDRRFDIPFVRTRALKHGLEDRLPQKGEMYILDTWDIAKKKLQLHSNRLDCIADALGIKNVKKTRLDPDLWMKAATGDPDALKGVALHNLRDVQILERVHKKLASVERPVYRSF